jgi:hypothetical protein
MNGRRMECVPGRGMAVRPLLSVGARLIAFGRFAPTSGQGDRGGIHGSRLVLHRRGKECRPGLDRGNHWSDQEGEGPATFCRGGSPAGPEPRADRNAPLIEVNVQRLSESGDEEPLGIAFNEDNAACEEQLSSSHVDVALKIGFVRGRQRRFRGRNPDGAVARPSAAQQHERT